MPRRSAKTAQPTLPSALRGLRVVNLAINAPGPAAAARLADLGATVVKIEPPGGDPLRKFCPAWYRELSRGQKIVRLNLKTAAGRARLDRFLAPAALLVTAQRRAALERLGLGWRRLHAKFPALCQVALVGYPAPRQNVPGHDLTYQAEAGLLAPPGLPPTLWLDLASAERMVGAALGLLLSRQRSGGGAYAEVAIADTARAFAAPLRHRLTAPGGLLGGGSACYNLYPASDGWVAVAALEPRFWQRLRDELKIPSGGRARLAAAFRARTARQWERWAFERDLPIAAVLRLV
ncbi:MAG TPA: CaiB/BaiF CoA-transferase family protein [Candidatus Acidoferrales bacterium]|nr:CaiB/BaiF CoA-transferase family protein [Candidatus Acidoferrales bacterium]